MTENKIPSHIRLPRSLLQDPLWKDLPLSYQHIFIVIIEKILYLPKRFDDHGFLIDLKPGQICISERELLKFCHKDISRNDIQRSLVKFKLYDFLSQEVIHKKNVLTIKHKDTYELILRYSEPRSEPNLSQSRAKLEPEKEKEDKDEKEEKSNKPPNPQTSEIAIACLFSGLDLSEDAKRALAKYPADRVKLAVEFVKSPSFKATKGIAQAMIWHCKQAIPPLSNEQKEVKNQQHEQTNMKTMKEIFEKCRKIMTELDRKRKVVFGLRGNFLNAGFVDSYEEISIHEKPYVFKQILESALRKRNLWINENVISIEEFQHQSEVS